MTRPGTLIRWNAVQSILKKSIRENITVVDIGAFDGYILGELKKKNDFVPFLLDIDIEGLKIAEKKGISVILASGTNVPLRNNSVEMVMCLDVIEHIKESKVLLTEITRILTKDGVLILSTPVANKRLVDFISTKKMKKIHLQWGHVKCGYTLQELQSLLKENNMNNVYVRQYFNIITRYLYYFLFTLYNPIPNRIKFILFKIGLLSERYVRISGLEYLIVARRVENEQ